MQSSLSPLERAAALDGSIKRFEGLGFDRATAVRAVARDNGLAPIQVVGAILLYNRAIGVQEAK